MATIKLQPSGNVLIKDGKVSCGCCEQPGCCPYPAAALVDGLYTYEDLPDAIDIEGIPYTKLDPPVFFGGVTLYYVDPFGEHLQIEDQGLDSTWQYEGGGNACLLNDAGMEDQFADTYTVEIFQPVDLSGIYTVTRRSLCVWSEEVEESGEVAGLTLQYFDSLLLPEIGFTWIIDADVLFFKTGFANTPEGQYNNGEATVS